MEGKEQCLGQDHAAERDRSEREGREECREQGHALGQLQLSSEDVDQSTVETAEKNLAADRNGKGTLNFSAAVIESEPTRPCPAPH